MKKKNIYILSEYFKREFYSNLLISIIACSRNFNVYIGTDKTYRNLLKNNLLEPGIFHTKSISHGALKSKLNEQLFSKGFILTSIDEEHGVIDYGNFKDMFIKPRLSLNDIKYFKAFFCWGSYDFKKLKKFFKKKNNIFYLTGSPRVDLWKKDFKNIWKNKKLSKKKYILIVSNFSFCNNHYSVKDIIIRKQLEGYYERSPNLKRDELNYYIYQKKTMRKFLLMVKKISRTFPEKKIIFRPHPTEKIDYWQNSFSNLSNVEIHNDGIISELINNSECVIQNGCTSAVESYISNIPVINYIPHTDKGQVFGKFVSEFAINIHSEKKLIDTIKSKSFKILKNKKKRVNERMMFLDKKLSSTKIVNTWRQLIKKKEKFNNNNHIKIRISLAFKEFFNFYFSIIVLFLKRKLYLKKIIFHKFSEINISKIENKIFEIKKILKNKKNIKVKKLGRELIYISTK